MVGRSAYGSSSRYASAAVAASFSWYAASAAPLSETSQVLDDRR